MLDVKLIYRLLDRAGIVILVNFAISLHVAERGGIYHLSFQFNASTQNVTNLIDF